ncbi:MAG TPA: VOC family protein [Candidatus Baltobacteraceae bacterium]|jgi:hypothetical protein|nr:VOC family protein [Candidatus Baltobacteraceae bacterium]
MGNPVVHFEIFGKDAPALRTFYRDVFQWHIGEAMLGADATDYTLVQPDGETGIRGGIGSCPEPSYEGHVTFYVQVPDINRALTEIEKRGGSKMMGPEQVPGGPIIALFRDPEGHLVGLSQCVTA